MKKTILLFFAFVSGFLSYVHAQEILILSNPKTHETDVFRRGSFLVFGLKKDHSVHEGFIREIRDSSIVFDDSQVSLSQIDVMAGSTKGKVVAGRVANAMANCLIIAGTAVFDCGSGIFLYSDSFYYWPIGGTIWLAGAAIAGLGYAFDWATCPLGHAVRVRNYKGWTASIVQEGSEVIEQKQDTGAAVMQPGPEKKEKDKNKRKRTGDDVYGE